MIGRSCGTSLSIRISEPTRVFGLMASVGDSASMRASTNNVPASAVIPVADLPNDRDSITTVIVSFCRKNHAGVNEVHDPGITCWLSFTSGRAVDIGKNGVARGVRECLHEIRNDA